MPSWELIAVEKRGRVEAPTWTEALASAAAQLGASVDPDRAVVYENGELEVVTEAGEVLRLVPAAPGAPQQTAAPTCVSEDRVHAAAPTTPALPTFEIEPVELDEGETLPISVVGMLHDVDPDAPTRLFGAVEPVVTGHERLPAVCVVEWESEAVA
jgi:hypothetical protein